MFILKGYPQWFGFAHVYEPTSAERLIDVDANTDSYIATTTFSIRGHIDLLHCAQCFPYDFGVLSSHSSKREVVDLYPERCMKERCIICGFVVFWFVQPDQVFVKRPGPLCEDFHRRGVIVEDDQDCV